MSETLHASEVFSFEPKRLPIIRNTQAENLLLVQIELVSNPFQPNQTHVKGQQEFSQTVVNAVK